MSSDIVSGIRAFDLGGDPPDHCSRWPLFELGWPASALLWARRVIGRVGTIAQLSAFIGLKKSLTKSVLNLLKDTMVNNYLDMTNALGYVAFCDLCLLSKALVRMSGFPPTPCSICGIPCTVESPVKINIDPNRVTLSWRRLRDEINKLPFHLLDTSVNFWDSSADVHYDLSNFEVFDGKAFLL